MSVRHVLTILAVEDLDRAARFYAAAFGFRERVRVPVYVELELDGGRGLGLYDKRGFARNTGADPSLPAPGTISGAELYFHVDDLHAAIEHLERAGGRALSPLAARDGGDEAAYFADPDGNVIAVARPLDRRATMNERRGADRVAETVLAKGPLGE